MRKIIVVILLLLFSAQPVCASEISVQEEIGKQMDLYEISKYDLEIKSKIGEIEGLEGKNFSEIVLMMLNGDLSLSFTEVLKLIVSQLFKEVLNNFSVMRNLIILAILAAAIKSIGSSFLKNSVGEIGYYIIYISAISMLIASFISASEIASSAISNAATFMQALIPLIIGLLVASGRYSISFIYHPATMGVIELATYFIKTVILNVIIFAAIIQMVNFLLPEGTLDNMTDLIKGIIGKGLKWITAIFIAVLSLRAVTAPIAGGIIGKGAKVAIGAVPVVGQAFSGAVDSVFYWGNAMKNGVAAASIVVVCVICAIPLIKLAAIALMYKLTAAIIQPITEERIVGCIDAAGNYILLFISAVACVLSMFVVLLLMVLSAIAG